MTALRSPAFGLSAVVAFALTACAQMPDDQAGTPALDRAEVLGANPEDNPLLGRWQAIAGGTGSWTVYGKIAFTKGRMYVEDQNGRLLRFKVRRFHVAENSVSARTAFGETYDFERVSANVICFEDPRIRKLDENQAASDTGPHTRRCYRRA